VIVARPALERRILTSLDAARIPVILGGCGSGRTSLLLRLSHLLGPERTMYIDMSGVATTPERCLGAVRAAWPSASGANGVAAPDSPKAAFDALLAFFDAATSRDGGPVTFLIDDILDIRTFESFPGLRHVQRDLVARLAASPNQFVLASRFTTRTHRLLRDAPPRFEVVHAPPLDNGEISALAAQIDAARAASSRFSAPVIAALTGGRPAYASILLGALAQSGPATDPLATLAALFAPGGRMTEFCRHCYEFRLHRARGYGALKAILGVLAEMEPLNLTDIALRLHRTPGSTKDYLSWLEDVDLVSVQRKRYSFEDPLLRVFVRLYGRAMPPSDEDIVHEIHGYAQARLPRAVDVPAAAAVAQAEGQQQPGIIEID
jgi:hypothetical protein